MANPKLNLAVLISGRGSNLQSLIDACQSADFPARIQTVIANKPDAYGLQRAEKAGIPAHIIAHKDYDRKQDFEQALIKQIEAYDVDVICLAGFMRILSADFINHFSDKSVINIHPSLLPAYKGINTHQRAIDDGQAEAGCTVHHVTADVDSGEIIIQKHVPIHDGDTADTLAQRILPQEHIAYPEAILALAKNAQTIRIDPYTYTCNINRLQKIKGDKTWHTPKLQNHPQKPSKTHNPCMMLL